MKEKIEKILSDYYVNEELTLEDSVQKILYLLHDVNIDKTIEEIENIHPYKQIGNRDSYSEYNEGWSDACNILGQKIKEFLLKI